MISVCSVEAAPLLGVGVFGGGTLWQQSPLDSRRALRCCTRETVCFQGRCKRSGAARQAGHAGTGKVFVNSA